MTDAPVKTAAQIHREKAEAKQASADKAAAKSSVSAVERQRKKNQKVAQAQAEASRASAARTVEAQVKLAGKAAKARADGEVAGGAFSPADAFRQKKMSQLVSESGEAALADGPVDPVMAALGTQLTADLAQLKGIESTEKKAAAKIPLFENYRTHIEARLEADEKVEDPIFALMAIWAVDIGEYQLATDMTAYLVRHEQKLPPPFKRTPASAIVEEIAQAALAEGSQVSIENLAYLLDAVTKNDWDMLDGVKAQLLKAVGRAMADKAINFDADAKDNPPGGQKGLIAKALETLRAALKADKDIGVKGDIKTLETLERKIASD